MAKILPLIIIIVLLVGGIFAGNMFRPPPKKVVDDALPYDQKLNYNYVKMTRQLVVPVMQNETNEVKALMIFEIWVELKTGTREDISQREPRLRDAFLQVLYRYSSEGAFDGELLSEQTQAYLRYDLTQTALEIVGPQVNAVLINDLQRQER